jgi:sulfoxide reductase heme-binding subunit YedZ
MSTTYRAIHWNPQKYRYDAAILFLLMLAVSSFASISMSLYPGMTIETLMLRGSAFLSLFVMQLILCIGPLARLNPRFLPLLYNRRHLGVFMFFLALIHAGIATIQHHALGDLFPLVSLFSSYAQEFSRALAHPTNLANVPFEPFGAAAMVILYLMAATSHDFWLRLLGSTVWKSLHMLVYFAYAAILLHVALGFLQAEFHVAYPVFVLSGAALVFGLHLAAFLRGRRPGDSAPMTSGRTKGRRCG